MNEHNWGQFHWIEIWHTHYIDMFINSHICTWLKEPFLTVSSIPTLCLHSRNSYLGDFFSFLITLPASTIYPFQMILNTHHSCVVSMACLCTSVKAKVFKSCRIQFLLPLWLKFLLSPTCSPSAGRAWPPCCLWTHLLCPCSGPWPFSFYCLEYRQLLPLLNGFPEVSAFLVSPSLTTHSEIATLSSNKSKSLSLLYFSLYHLLLVTIWYSYKALWSQRWRTFSPWAP